LINFACSRIPYTPTPCSPHRISADAQSSPAWAVKVPPLDGAHPPTPQFPSSDRVANPFFPSCKLGQILLCCQFIRGVQQVDFFVPLVHSCNRSDHIVSYLFQLPLPFPHPHLFELRESGVTHLLLSFHRSPLFFPPFERLSARYSPVKIVPSLFPNSPPPLVVACPLSSRTRLMIFNLRYRFSNSCPPYPYLLLLVLVCTLSNAPFLTLFPLLVACQCTFPLVFV